MNLASFGLRAARAWSGFRLRSNHRRLALVAALGPLLVCAPATATMVIVDPTTESWGLCSLAGNRCGASAETFMIVGGNSQQNFSTGAVEYALPTLPQGATLLSASLSIGAYSLYGETGRQGWRDEALGNVNVASYAGNGLFDSDDPFHQERVDFTLTHAATRLYDVTSLVDMYLGTGSTFVGFSFWQSPVAVCGYGNRCEVSLTGDTTEFAFQFDPANAHGPRLSIDFAEAPPPPLSSVPEPAAWLTLLSGAALVGLRKRPLRPSALPR